MQAPKFWKTRNIFALTLRPLSWLYQWISQCQRDKKIKNQRTLPVPVIVVGNINVGGTGKTPVTIALITELHKKGYRVGLISRGYGRKNSDSIIVSDSNVTAEDIGDEPYLIHQRTGVPIAVSGQRYDAGCALLERYPDLDVIVSDDGLQHYALHRDFEIAVFGQQGIGNGFILPAGPLREPVERLESVNAILVVDDESQFLLPYLQKCYKIAHRLGVPYQLNNSNNTRPWENFTNVSAVAGIAHPSNFFSALSSKNITFNAHPFEDHHAYSVNDFKGLSMPILMTEKDAVKCTHILHNQDVWVVPLETDLPPDFIEFIIRQLKI